MARVLVLGVMACSELPLAAVFPLEICWFRTRLS